MSNTLIPVNDYAPRKPQNGMLYDPMEFRERVYEQEQQTAQLTIALNLAITEINSLQKQVASLSDAVRTTKTAKNSKGD